MFLSAVQELQTHQNSTEGYETKGIKRRGIARHGMGWREEALTNDTEGVSEPASVHLGIDGQVEPLDRRGIKEVIRGRLEALGSVE